MYVIVVAPSLSAFYTYHRVVVVIGSTRNNNNNKKNNKNNSKNHNNNNNKNNRNNTTTNNNIRGVLSPGDAKPDILSAYTWRKQNSAGDLKIQRWTVESFNPAFKATEGQFCFVLFSFDRNFPKM